MDKEIQKSVDALILQIGEAGNQKRICVKTTVPDISNGLIKHTDRYTPGVKELIDEGYGAKKMRDYSKGEEHAIIQLNDKGRERYLMISGKTIVEYDPTPKIQE